MIFPVTVSFERCAGFFREMVASIRLIFLYLMMLENGNNYKGSLLTGAIARFIERVGVQNGSYSLREGASARRLWSFSSLIAAYSARDFISGQEALGFRSDASRSSNVLRIRSAVS